EIWFGGATEARSELVGGSGQGCLWQSGRGARAGSHALRHQLLHSNAAGDLCHGNGAQLAGDGNHSFARFMEADRFGYQGIAQRNYRVAKSPYTDLRRGVSI